MDRTITPFRDVLEPRRQETSNFMWISRELKTIAAYKQRTKPSPRWHKQEVLQSLKIQEIIRKLCQEQGASKEQFEQQIRVILNEIGYNKRLPVIRWLGLVLTKICVKVCSGIHVNEQNVIKLKQLMGNTPVIFLPSHRSYADFILMSYICFTYDLEIPAIAAGMDFHGMWGMGAVLRDTGAFFMRRSFNNDSLYWDTFRQYIQQLVTGGDLPIEFFIEGTRSRSGKSLMPKFGLLSMILKSYFNGEVPDILFVPINISYDRVLEEKLFAYELLGVPKPKESTSGFFKSLSIIKERFGNIYFDFGEPISARTFFVDRSVHSIKPLHMQEVTQEEKSVTSLLAYEILDKQQKLSVVTAFNLVALSLTNFKALAQVPRLDCLINDVLWLKNIFEALGALTDVTDATQNIPAALSVHRGLVSIDEDLKVDLVRNDVVLNSVDSVKLKGHMLSQETMSFAVPFVMLQIYVNPVLHYLVNPAFLVVILRHCGGASEDVLFGHYGFLRSVFSCEFVMVEKRNYMNFQESLDQLINLESVITIANKYYLSNKKLEELLCNALQPFIFTYYIVCRILAQHATSTEQSIKIVTQARLESLINNRKRFVHPYCLSLDTLGNCLASLVAATAIRRSKNGSGEVLLDVNHDVLCIIIDKLEMYVDFKPSDEELVADLKVCLESKL